MSDENNIGSEMGKALLELAKNMQKEKIAFPPMSPEEFAAAEAIEMTRRDEHQAFLVTHGFIEDKQIDKSTGLWSDFSDAAVRERIMDSMGGIQKRAASK